MKSTFDVICPIYNEEKTVPLFFERIKNVLSQLSENYECRLIFVDNCSVDKSQAIVRGLCETHPWVSLIVMSRNFGYQCSVECGLRNSDADWTGIVDVDCEDPPELFIDFLKLTGEGFDIVYGERKDREEIAFIKLLRKIYYRVTRAAADEHFILDMAEFCVMNSMVRAAVLEDTSSFPFIRASIGRVGYSIKNVAYKRHKRIAGETHYNFWRMFVFGVAGILSSSTLWLRIPTYLFPFWILFVCTFTVLNFATGLDVFFKLIIVGSLLYFGFIITGTSLYLARTYKNGLNRPNYYINSKKSLMPKRA